ncbi:LLM class flavin-dependent oxidoreductase [Kitasatospora indigofera]|uniref:LLM class flavin-dependent oxidoreductase n=1 Tax=Kitasatospora indigofera TaxID=67307 RepID=UPI0036C04496
MSSSPHPSARRPGPGAGAAAPRPGAGRAGPRPVRARPNHHQPALTAKALSTLDTIAPRPAEPERRLLLVEGRGLPVRRPFDVHDARYARTAEWLEVPHRLLTERTVTHHGALYELQDAVMEPKPARRRTVYTGGESPTAKDLISARGDAYVMHGDPSETIAAKIADMRARRTARGLAPLAFGVSGYVICRDTEQEAQDELRRVLNVRSSPRRTPPNGTSWRARTWSRRSPCRSTASPTAASSRT